MLEHYLSRYTIISFQLSLSVMSYIKMHTYRMSVFHRIYKIKHSV